MKGINSFKNFGQTMWKNMKNLPRPKSAEAKSFLIGVSGFIIVTDYVVSWTHCIGPSMEPTFNTNGSMALIMKFPYKIGNEKYEKGDVVICTSPLKPERRICKRIVALAGDYVPVRTEHRLQVVMVPEGHVWLEGDNPDNSHDSRHYGPVPIGLIVGKVVARSEGNGWNYLKWRFTPALPKRDLHEVIDEENRKKEQLVKERREESSIPPMNKERSNAVTDTSPDQPTKEREESSPTPQESSEQSKESKNEKGK